MVVTVTNAEAHRIAREKGVSGPLYLLVKYTAALVFRLVCGFTATGKENVPKKGPVVIVPNHKSFWDPFFVAIVLRRPVHFMGKAEHFDGPMATFFLRLGAFPVRRGESDEEALETARAILRRGDALALFPEGTRVREEGLGVPEARRRPARDRSRRTAGADHHHGHREATLAAAAEGAHGLRDPGAGRGPRSDARGRGRRPSGRPGPRSRRSTPVGRPGRASSWPAQPPSGSAPWWRRGGAGGRNSPT